MVFWVGLALWLALSLVPLHTLVPRWLEARGRAGGTSPGPPQGHGASSPTAAGMRYSAVLGKGQRGGVEDTYVPAIPAACPPDFTRTLQALFRPEGYGTADPGLVAAPLAASPGRPARGVASREARHAPASGSFRSPGTRGWGPLRGTWGLPAHAEEEGEEGSAAPSTEAAQPGSSSPSLLTPRGSVLLQSQSWLWEPSAAASAILRQGGAGRAHGTPATGERASLPRDSPAAPHTRGPLGMAASRSRLFSGDDLS